MIRVLHVLGQLNIGGAESRIMDLYRCIDRNRVQFDFVVHGDSKGYFEDEIESLGGKIYHIPRFKIYNIHSYKKAWRDLLSKNSGEHKFIQGHMTSTASIYLPIAKKEGLLTIAHARSAGVDAGVKGYITKLLRLNLSKKADYLFSCSKLASEAVFGKKAYNKRKIVFLPNCINVSKFRFDYDTRLSLRMKLGVENANIYGHVGRFHYAKNHEFLLNVFKEISLLDEKAILVLVGDGPRMQKIKALSEELEIKERVIFEGMKTNISDYYQAMDCFIYPSRYEGLPGTVVEAQASGLPVLMSDSICDEVAVTELISSLSLSDDPKKWAEKAVNLRGGNANHTGSGDLDVGNDTTGAIEIDGFEYGRRYSYNQKVMDAGFEVTIQANKLMEFYESGNAECLA